MTLEVEVEIFWKAFHAHAHRAATSGPPTLFRGQTNIAYDLLPSIARNTSAGTAGDIQGLEDDLIRNFKLSVAPILEKSPATEIEWLFLAQHYGLPTRLLDWTTNPMVALFFAVEGNDDKDAAVHVFQSMVTDQYELIDYRKASVLPEKQVGMLKVFAIQPKQGEVIFVRPRYTDHRYLNQRSVFSCPSDPYKALEGTEQLVVKGAWKPRLREILRTFGIAHSFVYPGLEGSAREIRSAYFDPVQAGRHIVHRATIQVDLPS